METTSPKSNSGFSKILKLIGILALLVGLMTGIIQLYEAYQKNKIKDLTDNWVLKYDIKETTHKKYFNLTLGYKLNMTQQEDATISGLGEKFLENNVAIPFKERINIQFTGRNYGDSIVLLIHEKGKLRETSSTVRLRKNNDHTFNGTFISTAANCSGIATMEKYLPVDYSSSTSDQNQKSSYEQNSNLNSTVPTTATVATSDFLALKSTPDIEGQRILKINNNEVVHIILKTQVCETIDDIYDCWYKINYQGNEGYVFGGYLLMQN